MTTVRIKLSQEVVDMQAGLAPALNGDLGNMLDVYAGVLRAIAGAYSYYDAYQLNPPSLRMQFADGAYRNYTDFTLSNPSGSSGKATFSGNEFVAPGNLYAAIAGVITSDYLINANGLQLGMSQPAMLSGIRYGTLFPTDSAAYGDEFGNVAIALDGRLVLTPAGTLTGFLHKVSRSADKYILSSEIEGNFGIVVDVERAGLGSNHASVTGTLASYKNVYQDGSYYHVTDAQTMLTSAGIDDSIARAFSGNDDIVVELPTGMGRDIVIEAGAGDDAITLIGGGGWLHASAGAGNDVIRLKGDGHWVDGGTGFDTVIMDVARADATVMAGDGAGSFYVFDALGNFSELVNVERLVFTDATVALDIDGSAGQAYRLYQAAFNRTPDDSGLSFWIDAMDRGERLDAVAHNFMASDEFVKAYGANPSNTELVTRFYENILQRKPDAGGLAYWTDILDSKAATAAQVLASISESEENQIALIGVIGDGFTFTPYGH